MTDFDIRELVEQVRRVADALEHLTSLFEPAPERLPRLPRSPLSVLTLVKETCKTDMTSRERADLRARRVAIYVMRAELELSYPRIAAALGYDDHSTALYNFRLAERSYAGDVTFRSLVEQVKNRLDSRPA